MMEWMMNPLKALRYFLWEQYKVCFAKFVILAVIGAIMGLFFYSMPVSLLLLLFAILISRLVSLVFYYTYINHHTTYYTCQ